MPARNTGLQQILSKKARVKVHEIAESADNDRTVSKFRPHSYRTPPALGPLEASIGAAPTPLPSPRVPELQHGSRVAAAAPPGGMFTALTLLFGFYLFLHMAYASEVFGVLLGFRFPLVYGIMFVLACLFLLAGKVARFMKTPFAAPWLLMLGFLWAASLFGIYRGRSVPAMLQYGIRFHLMIAILFCGIALTAKQIRVLMHFMSAGAIVILFLCWRYGQPVEDRFGILKTSLENPNDLAFHLLYGSAFLLLLVLSKSVFARLLWLVTFPVTVLYVLKTGSRASFLTLILISIVLLFIASPPTKILILLLAPFMSLSLFLVPHATLQRLTMIVLNAPSAKVSTNDERLASAVDSQVARTTLQERALELTLHHPLLGIGPLNFADAVEAMVQSQGKGKSGWQNPHNGYLQISSECGVPAMICYIWSVVLCIRVNYQSYKTFRNRTEGKDIAAQSLCLLLASIIYALGTAFSNIVYLPYLCFLVGFSAANYLVTRDAGMPERRAPRR